MSSSTVLKELFRSGEERILPENLEKGEIGDAGIERKGNISLKRREMEGRETVGTGIDGYNEVGKPTSGAGAPTFCSCYYFGIGAANA